MAGQGRQDERRAEHDPGGDDEVAGVDDVDARHGVLSFAATRRSRNCSACTSGGTPVTLGRSRAASLSAIWTRAPYSIALRLSMNCRTATSSSGVMRLVFQ